MKTRAGPDRRRLYGMKPRSARASAAATMKMSRFGETNAAERAKHEAATTPRLPARPSMLSSRLKAFVSPTSQRIPTAQASTGLATNSTEMELLSTRNAASELGAELRGGMEVDDVVEQPEGEDDRAARQRPSPSLRRSRPVRSRSRGRPRTRSPRRCRRRRRPASGSCASGRGAGRPRTRRVPAATAAGPRWRGTRSAQP